MAAESKDTDNSKLNDSPVSVDMAPLVTVLLGSVKQLLTKISIELNCLWKLTILIIML